MACIKVQEPSRSTSLYGLAQSKFDSCLFIGPEVICVDYVDDLIFWAKEVQRSMLQLSYIT